MLAPPVLHIRMLHHLAHRCEFDARPLDGDHGCALGGGATMMGPSVLFEERHTFHGQPHGARTIYW